MLILSSDVRCAGRNRVPNRPADLLKNTTIIYLSISMILVYIHILYVTEILDQSLTYVHVCVVTKVEGNTPGDAATTTSQLRRSDRGGFPYDML